MLWEHQPVTEDCSFVSRRPRFQQPGHGQDARSGAVPVLPFPAGPPELRVWTVGPARQPVADDGAGPRQLHELPLASARIEPPLGFVADTVIDMEQRSHKLSIAVATVLLAASSGVQAEKRPPRTRRRGPARNARSRRATRPTLNSAQAGSMTRAQNSATTGLDEDGVLATANATGGAMLESATWYTNCSTWASIRARNNQGHRCRAYEFGLSYDRIPHRISDTGETVFGSAPSLSFAAGWVTRAARQAWPRWARACVPWTLVSIVTGMARTAATSSATSERRTRLQARRAQRHAPALRLVRQRVVPEMLRPIDDTTDRINPDVRSTRASTGSRSSATWRRSTTPRPRPSGSTTPSTRPSPAAIAGRWRSSQTILRSLALSLGWYGLPGNTVITLSGAMARAPRTAASTRTRSTRTSHRTRCRSPTSTAT